MDQTAARISEYAASLTTSDVTPEALHAVERSLIDSVGCALAALSAEPVKIARKLSSQVSGSLAASVLGTSMKTSPEMAAFTNGTMVRYLDFNDDYINKDGPHPSDNISAILAVSEAMHADGRTLALGITLAYEVVGQLVDSVGFRHRGWDYVTETSIGSALGACKVLGCSKDQMAQALALAIVPNIGLRQARVGELSMWKGSAGPNAARNGVFAALLAREGMTGPDEPIEGPCALMKQVTGPFSVGPFGGHGHPFKIQNTFFKQRPAVYTVLLSVETALKLRDKIDLDKVDSIKVVLDAFCILTSNQPEKWDPHTRETADHSIPYLVAAALVDGDISEKTYTPEHFRDPKILAIVKKITLEEDPQYTRGFPGTFSCRIEVTDKQGRKVTQELKNPKGHPANPMTDAELEDKFLKLTQGTLGSKRARAALALMWKLEAIKDVGSIPAAVLV